MTYELHKWPYKPDCYYLYNRDDGKYITLKGEVVRANTVSHPYTMIMFNSRRWAIATLKRVLPGCKLTDLSK